MISIGIIFLELFSAVVQGSSDIAEYGLTVK